MNGYITLVCVLAVAGLSQAVPYGYGGYGLGGYGLSSIITAPIIAPAAVSTANVWKGAPIPVIKTIAAPIITAPIIKTVPVIKTVAAPVVVSSYGLGGYGLGGLGYGLDGLGYGKGLGLGWGKL